MVDFEIGSIIDERYEILSVLGSGGMGCVYKARQLNLDRTVAIKVPSKQVLESVEFRKRFIREAHLCAKVSHPHVVSIFDVHGGESPYIVMALVDGMPLNQFLIEECTTIFVSDLVEIIRQICLGLDAAHAQGIIHRDIKPANIVITHDTQQVKIMDFGIARSSDNTVLTLGNSMMGTPYYMAPEQIRGEKIFPATDLYALGCIVYSLFTGKYVFRGEVATLLYKHTSVPPVPPGKHNSMLPPEVDTVLLRALDKDPSKRHESAMDFQRELRKALRPLTHLPYSQIFPQTLESTRVKKPAPAKPKPRREENGEVDAFSPTVPIASAAPTEEDKRLGQVAMASIVPPYPEAEAGEGEGKAESRASESPKGEGLECTGPLPTAFRDMERVETQGPDEHAAEKGGASSAFFWIGSAVCGIGVLAAALYFIPAFLGKTSEGNLPNVKPPVTPAPVETVLPVATEAPLAKTPVPVVARDVRLSWLVKDEPKVYHVGDYLTVRWSALPKGGYDSPHVYRVELANADTEKRVQTKTTRYENAVFGFDGPGRYTLTIHLQGSPSFKGTEPLKKTFEVRETPEDEKGP